MIKNFSCPICKSNKALNGKYNYIKCLHCKSFILKNMPSDREIDSSIEKTGNLIFKSVYKNKKIVKVFENRLKRLSKYIKQKSDILDVGCGQGIFLDVARQNGYKSFAMDKSSNIVKEMEKKGFVSYRDFRSIPNRKFDAITLFDVIEHTPEPHKMIQEIKSKFKKGGILMITTPNCLGITARIFPKQIENEYRDHCVVFNPDSLKQLLIEEGFEILSIKTDTILQWFWVKNKLLEKVVNKIIYLIRLPFNRIIFYEGLGDNIEIIGRVIEKNEQRNI